MRAEDILVKNKIISYVKDKKEKSDFFSMAGGKFNVITKNKPFLMALAKLLNKGIKECALTYNIKNIEQFLLFLDFDFKEISIDETIIEKICYNINSVLKSIYKDTENIELYVFKRGNNLHIYSNLIINRNVMCYFIKLFIEAFEKNIMKNENTTNGEIVDDLRGYKQGVRIECFNKCVDKMYKENTAYTYSYEYSDNTLMAVSESYYNSLLKSCFYDISTGINKELIEGINEKVIEHDNKKLEKSSSVEKIDWEDITPDIIAKSGLFFKELDQAVLNKIFVGNFTFNCLMAFKNFCRYKKLKLNTYIEKINNEFFGMITDINTKTPEGITYELKNKKTLRANTTTYQNIHIGHIIAGIAKVNEELAEEYKLILAKDDITIRLEKEWKEYKAKKKLRSDNYNPGFLQHISNKTYPLNKDLVLSYMKKHFIYLQSDNTYYNVYIENKKNRNNVETSSIKLKEWKEAFFQRAKLRDDSNKEISLSSIFSDDEISYRYTEFGFYPGQIEDQSVYNLFDGFDYEKINVDIKDSHRDTFTLYLDYIRKYVCEGSAEQYHYLMSLLSNIINDSAFKPQICPIFYSDEKGTGKSSLTKLLRDVIGHKYSYTGNIEEITNVHSTSSEYKFTNFIEEFDAVNAHKTIENLKDRIQRDTTNINRKYKNIVEVNDYTRYFLLTNNRIAILPRNHRRFVCYHFKKVMDANLLKVINEVYETNRPIYAKLFGEYLSNYKYEYRTRTQWINGRCGSDKINLFVKTTIIEEILEKIYANNNVSFDIIKKGNNIFFDCKDFYEMYESMAKKFCKKYKAFIDDITENYAERGLITFIDGRIKKIKINLNDLYDYLVSIQLIDNSGFVCNYFD